VRDHREDEPETISRRDHDEFGTPYDRDLQGLRRNAQTLLKCDPIFITLQQAELLLQQFQETSQYRGWNLIAVAIMSNHVHWLVDLRADQLGKFALQSFKAYGSRILNNHFGKPASETWWTQYGSARWKPKPRIRPYLIRYVMNQKYSLVTWLNANEHL